MDAAATSGAAALTTQLSSTSSASVFLSTDSLSVTVEAIVELTKHGFRPVTALSIETWGDAPSRDDAWILCSLYAAELQGWILTSYLDFDTAVSYQGGDEHGLLHVPIGGRRRSVLIAASTMRELAGSR